jgi:feruloyl esterase
MLFSRILSMLFSLASFLAFTNASTSDFRQACLSFAPTSFLANTTLRLQEHIPANTTITLSGMDPTCSRTLQLISQEACRIALTIPTSNRSGIIFEIFLPTPDSWTGRFLSTGNGGIDGCIKYEDISYGISHGFATTGSNNGHNGTGGESFLNNPDSVADFSYRSIHTAAVSGKILTDKFYGKSHQKSYYIGCSGGGRQGVQAASL